MTRLFLALGLALGLAAATAHAQFEMRGSSFSRMFLGTVPDGITPAVTTPQFAADYGNTGGSSAISDTGSLSDRFPKQVIVDAASGLPTGTVIVLLRSTSGGSLAPGVPRYALGDTIAAPSTQDGGVIVADANYWRAQPVQVGESFSQTATSTTDPPIAPNVAPIPVTH
eukprot:gene36070-48547_t